VLASKPLREDLIISLFMFLERDYPIWGYLFARDRIESGFATRILELGSSGFQNQGNLGNQGQHLSTTLIENHTDGEEGCGTLQANLSVLYS
jgi:hypothetical protein